MNTIENSIDGAEKNLNFFENSRVADNIMTAFEDINNNILYNMNNPPRIETDEIRLLREYRNTTGKSPYLRVKKQETIDLSFEGNVVPIGRKKYELDTTQYSIGFKNFNKKKLREGQTTLYIPDKRKVFLMRGKTGKLVDKKSLKYDKKLKKYKHNNTGKFKKDGQLYYTDGSRYDKIKLKKSGITYTFENDFQGLGNLAQINYTFKQLLRPYGGQEIFIVSGINGEEQFRRKIKIPQGPLGGFYNKEKLYLLLQSEDNSDEKNNIMNPVNNMTNIDSIVSRNEQGFVSIYPVKGFTGERVFNQSFLDGKVSHCVIDPMISFCNEKIRYYTNKNKKYEVARHIKARNKLEQYKEKYKSGVDKENLQEICDVIGFNVSIFLPQNTYKEKEWIVVKGNKGMLNYTKSLSYINSRWNHLDILTSMNNLVKVGTREQLQKLEDYYKSRGEYCAYTEYHQKNCLLTTEGKIKLHTDYNEAVEEFIKQNKLNYYLMDEKLDKPSLTDFIDCAIMTNGTFDFINTSKYRYDINSQWRPEDCSIEDLKNHYYNLALSDGINHIDMTKAYTKSEDCSFYEGYLGKIWEFRTTDKIVALGYYQVKNIRNIHPLIERLGTLFENNVYFSPELKFYESLGIKFDIVCGCWGCGMEIKWNERMMNKTPEGLSYYCKWFGCGCITNDTFDIKIDTDNKDWIHNLHSVMTNEDVNIKYINNRIKKDDERPKYTVYIESPVKSKKHYKHICGGILSYQRITMIQQLLKFKMENLVRVCVDGIYYKGDTPEIIKPFSKKTSLKFGNSPGNEYRHDTTLYLSTINHDFNCGKYKKYSNEVEVHIGPGGCGKTYKALTDDGYNSVLYVAHSWKLCRAKAKEFNVVAKPNQRITLHIETKETKSYVDETIEDYNVLVIDEVSTMSYQTQMKIIKYYGEYCKLIFCGDISRTSGIIYQCPPFQPGIGEIPGFTIKDDYLVVGHNRNRRCKETHSGQQLLQILNTLRAKIEWSYKYSLYKKPICKGEWAIKELEDKGFVFNYVGDDFDYNNQDFILSKTHKRCRYFDEKFKHIEKYKILEGFGIKSNIVLQRPSGKEYTIEEGFTKKKFVNGGYRVQHGYTIDSIQGETISGRLFLDLRSIGDLRVLYTAMSRAKELNQIYIIKC